MTRSPKEFADMLEHFFGFQIEKCEEKEGCSALATTKDGYIIAWNGYCRNFIRIKIKGYNQRIELIMCEYDDIKRWLNGLGFLINHKMMLVTIRNCFI